MHNGNDRLGNGFHVLKDHVLNHLMTGRYPRKSLQLQPRGGCARVIECNRSSSAHHRVSTFFPTLFNLIGKGSGHAQTTRGMAERQSSDGNKRPRGTPTFLTLVRPKIASS